MSRRYSLSDKDLKTLDYKLYNFKRIDNAIIVRKRELEVRNSYDENIGGGRSNIISKPVEDIVIKWDSDPTLRNLYAFNDVIKNMLNLLNDEMKLIFHYRWVDPNRYTWEEIADLVHMSERTIYRKRRAILELYDECSGGIW